MSGVIEGLRVRRGSYPTATVAEASSKMDDNLNAIITSWQHVKPNYVHMVSSLRLAFPMCNPPKIPQPDVVTLDDVYLCYKALQSSKYTDSAFALLNFLKLVENLQGVYVDILEYRPTVMAAQEGKKARYVKEFCTELEKWRQMLERRELPKKIHRDIEVLSTDANLKKQTGHMFSIIPVMIDHAQKLICTMKSGWPQCPGWGANSSQRPRTAGLPLTEARLHRSTSASTLQPLSLSGYDRSDWRPGESVVEEPVYGIPKSTSLQDVTLRGRRLSVGDISPRVVGDVSPRERLQLRSLGVGEMRPPSPSLSSTSSAYETGPAISISNSRVTFSQSSSDTEPPWSPATLNRQSFVREVTDAIEKNFHTELSKVTERLEKKITDATDNLREDMQNDLKQRDKRIAEVKQNVEQLSKYVDEKFSDIDTEIMRFNVSLKDYIRPLNERQINVIAENIGPNVYRKLARELGIRTAKLQWMEEKCRGDEQEVTIAVLNQWKQSSGMKNATLENVIRSLVKIKERPTANQILKALNDETE